MNKKCYLAICAVLFMGAWQPAQGGNPDRQGEAGAYELLMNPWARSAGLHTMTTGMVSGVEAMRLNIAGLARIRQTEVVASHAIYLQGTGISMSSFGVAQRVGEHSALGFSVMSVDFGEIPETRVDLPEGTGATFSPTFINIGLGFSHVFENKVQVGVLFRAVSERIANAAAATLALDAGVQYVTGPQDNFKFGISLRNVGGRMRFSGEGLSFQAQIPEGSVSYNLAVNQRAADFELQSMLNIGMSYDFHFATHRFTVLSNFTSNAFSRDQIGVGVEFAFAKVFMLRGAYRYEFGTNALDLVERPVYTGPSAGFTVNLPFSKREDAGSFALDYAYRATKIWGGTHNFSLRINL